MPIVNYSNIVNDIAETPFPKMSEADFTVMMKCIDVINTIRERHIAAPDLIHDLDISMTDANKLIAITGTLSPIVAELSTRYHGLELERSISKAERYIVWKETINTISGKIYTDSIADKKARIDVKEITREMIKVKSWYERLNAILFDARAHVSFIQQRIRNISYQRNIEYGS